MGPNFIHYHVNTIGSENNWTRKDCPQMKTVGYFGLNESGFVITQYTFNRYNASAAHVTENTLSSYAFNRGAKIPAGAIPVTTAASAVRSSPTRATNASAQEPSTTAGTVKPVSILFWHKYNIELIIISEIRIPVFG